MKNIHLLGIAFLLCSPAFIAAEPSVGGKPKGTVARAQFTTEVVNREPVDLVTVLENDRDEIQFFSDIRDMAGRTITHRWEFEGQVMAEIDFEVGGPRWRVHSSKTLLPIQVGKWTVVVVDQSGWPMHAEMFEYRQAAARPQESMSEQTPAEAPMTEVSEPVVDTEETPQTLDQSNAGE